VPPNTDKQDLVFAASELEAWKTNAAVTAKAVTAA
jgi:hypothetical protein